MDLDLQETLDKKIKYFLSPTEEYELLVRDGVGYPTPLDLLKESYAFFDLMSLSGEITSIPSALIGFVYHALSDEVPRFWKLRFDEIMSERELTEDDIRQFTDDLGEFTKIFNALLPSLKTRIRNVGIEYQKE